MRPSPRDLDARLPSRQLPLLAQLVGRRLTRLCRLYQDARTLARSTDFDERHGIDPVTAFTHNDSAVSLTFEGGPDLVVVGIVSARRFLVQPADDAYGPYGPLVAPAPVDPPDASFRSVVGHRVAWVARLVEDVTSPFGPDRGLTLGLDDGRELTVGFRVVDDQKTVSLVFDRTGLIPHHLEPVAP